MDKTERNKQWHARIADFKASGQTMKTWCAVQGMTIHQLKYWLRKTSNAVLQDSAPKKSRWVSVPVSEREAELLPPHPLVIRMGQTAIEVRADFDATLLRQVVRALEVPC